MSDTITMPKIVFEHLLNCLANQRFVHEAPPCGDAMAMDPADYAATRQGIQAVIDKAWLEGHELLRAAP